MEEELAVRPVMLTVREIQKLEYLIKQRARTEERRGRDTTAIFCEGIADKLERARLGF